MSSPNQIRRIRRIASTLVLAGGMMFAAMLATIAADPGAFARSRPGTTDKGTELVLYRESVVNGVSVPAGTYRIKVAPTLDSATVFENGAPVVTAPCRVTVADGVLLGTSVYYDAGGDGAAAVNRIVLSPSKLSIDFVEGARLLARDRAKRATGQAAARAASQGTAQE
jgi:hypothetical protein